MARLRKRSRTERLRRLIRYKLIIPVFRSPHPAEYTARGVAIGVFWGVTPFMGLQTLLMVATWIFMKRVLRKDASLVQSLIWAWVNNPLTMVPMYYLFYVTGLWLTGTSSGIGGYDAFVALWDTSRHEPSFGARVALLSKQIGLALSVGCAPYALIFSRISYSWALAAVNARRSRIRRFDRAQAELHA